MNRQAFTAAKVYVEGAFRADTWLAVEDDVITAVTTSPPDGFEVRDLGDRALFPGAVNTHTHSFQSLLRGRMDERALPEWLQGVYSAAAGYGVEECYVGAALTFGEMLRSGTTCVADFFYLNARGNDNARAVIHAAKDLGMRLVLGRAALDAEWAGDGARESIAQAVHRVRELALEFKADPFVTVSPAPHSIYGASRPMLEAMAQLAEEFNTQWYVHVADAKGDEAHDLNRGQRTIPMLHDWKILSDRVVLAHALFLRPAELDLIAEAGAKVSCNPASGMFFGDGVLNLPKLWRHGIRVGLATDGAASNNGLNLFHEAHIASLGQKLIAEDPAAVSASQIVRLATIDGGEVLTERVGRLAAGYKADFLVLDTSDFTLQPEAALESNIVHAMSEHAIASVYCGGREVVHQGQLMCLDQKELLNRARAVTSTLAPALTVPM